METKYVGEHLLPGQIGHFLVLLAFFTALFSAVYYFISLKYDPERAKKLQKIARITYIVHFVAIIGMAVTLLYLLLNHYFEYNYVWRYSSTRLSTSYLVSTLWAGQEGSFILWAFWQGLIGIGLIAWVRKWESGAAGIVALSQAILLSLLIGIELGAIKIGSSPFALLREVMQDKSGFFQNPNYVSRIMDGNGLNPLLENPWMVSHPPVLFLGYASVIAPFAIAMASLFKKDYHGWIKSALPWMLFSLIALGSGILLGGRWAYESLTFGGFWAWDPVENASLVPWLGSITALHFMIIANKKKHAFLGTYAFTALAYLFVLYASFLTRSGILGETSVHSFGNDGKTIHLLIYILVFLGISLYFILKNRKQFPKKSNDDMRSREFWIMVGAVILFLSAFQITITTSIPVINAIFGTDLAPPVDPVAYYNNWQLPYALLVMLMIPVGQYFAYGRNSVKKFWRRVIFSVVVAAAFTVIIAWTAPVVEITRIAFLFAILLTAVASLDYIFRYVKKVEKAGGFITHVGFAIFLLGVLITFSNSKVVSHNTSSMDLGDPKSNRENLLLMRDSILPMDEYHLKYSNREDQGVISKYTIEFYKDKEKVDKREPVFRLNPTINRNEQMGYVYNPDTEHSLWRDVYAFITYAPEKTQGPDNSKYTLIKKSELSESDTLSFPGNFVILDELTVDSEGKGLKDVTITATVEWVTMAKRYERRLHYRVKGDKASRKNASIQELGVMMRFEGVADTPKTIELGIYEEKQDYIVIKSMIFPYINVMWAGFVIMMSGLSIAMIRRIKW
ncbi:MAG: cytochrome c biogenesis protein CcsA [Bacteroidales bacterium]|nr:cytochrome c biogenesis protein CcsA [Bacteroidales bacterium]